jgi:hypothetical protein
MTRWFKVELPTLRLIESEATDWPESVKSVRTRMIEECLESLVAFNLDILFPDEHLLLVNTQHQIMNVADVLAVDPLGMVRVMELKKESVKRGDLETQVISYALHRQSQTPWPKLLAQAISFLPERIEMSIEGFRANKRAKSLGDHFVRPHFTGERWDDIHRFRKARIVADVLRSQRGEKPGVAAAQNPDVLEVVNRLYALPLQELDLGNCGRARDQIIERRWGFTPNFAGREFTLVAPGAGSANTDHGEESELEARGALFCLIDADLRMDRQGEAILRWSDSTRTIDTEDLRTAIAMTLVFAREHPDVPMPRFDPNSAEGKRKLWCHWHDEDRLRLSVETDGSGRKVFATGKSWLTEGFGDLNAPRLAGLRRIRTDFERALLPVRAYGAQGEICVPWDRHDVRPAIALAVAYYKLNREIGAYEPFRWFRRP